MKKILISFICGIILVSCSSQNSEDSYTDDGGQERPIGNPYSSGSGHYAGYEWAERTGGSCSGYSQSFNEGCEEYYNQTR